MAIFDYEKEKRIEEVRTYALKKLSYSLRTEKEIREYLKEKGCYEIEIDDTISFLIDYKYLDDSNYSYQFYKLQKQKLKAEKRIRNELENKGISEENIDKGIDKALLLKEYEEDLITSKKVLEKMIKGQNEIDEKFKARVFRRLVSYGYDMDLCYKIISKLNR